ncbi:hypothetical protein OAN307_c16010 [Octadecabacter antarcticus 307]|uniref:Uncharacterized protein n=1 Tax=Octadecabacter antarcticus 307 TaxID=391626 RepID=M9R3P7_9RHOB|nr:hypothetical protein [Octadecabacter antarcticus]AGI67274.1 hypothetical protein OAN307_c16010 [Octadecabacter antarcticus 307]
MIRLAFLGVILLGGLIAFAGFYLVRGSEPTPMETQQLAQPNPTPPPPVVAEVEKLYFLQDIDLDQGDIALVLFNLGPAPLFVRDIDVIRAALGSAYVNMTDAVGQVAGQFTPATNATLTITAPPEDIIAQIYRNDTLVGTVSCAISACGSFVDTTDINYAGLRTAAAQIQRIEDRFDTHADYLSTIEAVAADPDFMLLHAHPQSGFPQSRDAAAMQISFPTVITPTSAPLDTVAHELLVSLALTAVLPDDANLRDVTITDLGNGVVGDGDSRTPVLAGGAPIPYPNVRYYSVTAWVDGAADLDQLALDTLTNQTLDQYDFAADFTIFTRERLQSACADCFWILVDGGSRDDVRVIQSQPESYELEYFDLRDTP